jgi:hypothetical protein
VFLQLKAGVARRTSFDIGHLINEPGSYTLQVHKCYDADDRKAGGAWFGATEAAEIKFDVVK